MNPQTFLALAGYRVIAYSRPNYYEADPAPDRSPGIDSADVPNSKVFLGVKQFHANLVTPAKLETLRADTDHDRHRRLADRPYERPSCSRY